MNKDKKVKINDLEKVSGGTEPETYTPEAEIMKPELPLSQVITVGADTVNGSDHKKRSSSGLLFEENKI